MFFNICEGNPGALAFLLEAYKMDSIGAEKAFRRMYNNNITGDKLYMLWNDCCDRDTKKTIQIMRNHTINDIIQHINYENGRGIKYAEEELITSISKKYLLDGGNFPTNSLSNYKLYGGYCVVDTKGVKEIEQAKDMLFQQCLSVIKDVLQENKETFLDISEDKSHPHCLIGCWKILLPTGDDNIA